MPSPKPRYGLVINDNEKVGSWRTENLDKIVLNLEEGELEKFLTLTEDGGANYSFLVDDL